MMTLRLSAALALFLCLSLAQGFGVGRRPMFGSQFKTKTALFVAEPQEEPIVDLSTGFAYSDDDDLALVEPGVVDKEELSVKVGAAVDELSSKAQELSGKAQELAAKAEEIWNDPTVQEIATNAKEFAQEVTEKIVSTVTEKLKEIKEEKLNSDK